MKKEYKISDIKSVLKQFQQQHPSRQNISFKELEKRTQEISIPAIYNLEELIDLLSGYISENKDLSLRFYSEAEVCRILKLSKLTMHKWRKNGNISYLKAETRTIRYNLETLLVDLKGNRE